MDAGRDAMDADALLTNGAEADGKVVWFWHPDAGVKSALTQAQATVAKKPGAPGRARSSRNTIAQGRPVVFR